MDRKGIMLLALLFPVVLVAGCSGLLVEDVDHEISVVNDGEVPRTVHVTVERSDSVLVGETHRLQAGEQWLVTTLDAPGEYRVVVSTSEGVQLTAAYSLPMVEGDRRSFLDVRIEAGGSLEKQRYWET